VAAGLSVLIESLQAILPEHATDVDDVILTPPAPRSVSSRSR
jgi:glycopeptide antibiotics resistance protein